MNTYPIVLVPGTHGLDNQWRKMSSCFVESLINHNFALLDKKDLFIWTAHLDGVLGKNTTWQMAGYALLWYCHAKEKDVKVNIIAHSHGGQVAAYAAERGLQIHTLITAGTPVRYDMRNIYKKGKQSIEKWVHLHSGAKDWWQLFGSFFDGSLNNRRDMPYASLNIEKSGCSHEELLDYKLWDKENYWQYLR